MAEPFEVGASLTFSGRTFSPEELELIGQVSRDFPSLGRTEISRTVCELLDWRRASGRLKNHECRLLLERLEGLGWLRLPAVRRLGGRGPRRGGELLERYHYLGYRVPVGAQLCYWVRSPRSSDQVLACLLWSSAAWRIAVRERWIGWREDERRQNLPLIV